MKFLVFVTAVSLFFTSCDVNSERVEGNGKVTTETREAKQAAKIKVLGGIDVIVNQGPTSIKIEADENVLKYIITEDNDGWLEVKTRDNISLHTTNDIKVYISTPVLNGVQIAGSGNLTANGKFASDSKMLFTIMGSGNATVDVNTPAVEAEISGSGNVNVSGETRDVEVDIAGSGKFEGTNLKAENVKVAIAGSGDAFVFAESKLKASIAGSGNVRYKGNAEIDKDVAGSGTVEKIN